MTPDLVSVPQWSPLSLTLLATATVVVLIVGVSLVRERPVSYDRHAPEGPRRNAAHVALHHIGRPLGGLLTAQPWLYTRLVDRWLRQAAESRETTTRDFVDDHAGLAITGVALTAVMVFLDVPTLLVVGLLLLAVALPLWKLRGRALARQRRIEREMPAFLDVMSVLLSAGMTFRQALARVSPRLRGPLQEETSTVLEQLHLGYTPVESFVSLSNRTSAPTLERLMAIARQNISLGVPIAGALSELALQTRAETMVRLRLRAEAAATKGSVLTVLLTVPAVLGLIVCVLVADLLKSLQGWAL